MSKLNRLEQNLVNYYYRLRAERAVKEKAKEKLQVEMDIIDGIILDLEAMLTKEDINRSYDHFEKNEKAQENTDD